MILVSHLARLASPRNLQQAPRGSHIGLLKNVLGLAVLPHDGARRPEKTLIIAFHDGIEGGSFAAEVQLNKLRIRQLLQVCELQEDASA